MNETPITDASVMRLALTPELGRFPNGEWVPASVARQLESELANAYKGYRACNDDLIKLSDEYDKLSDQVMRWFKAASPYATPGSLEGALKALASTLTDACVLIDGFKQGESWSEWDRDVRRRLGEALRTLS